MGNGRVGFRDGGGKEEGWADHLCDYTFVHCCIIQLKGCYVTKPIKTMLRKKAHTCVYKVPQFTLYVRTKNKP